VTEQLIGRDELGASGFKWCGNILPVCHSGEERRLLADRLVDMVTHLTRRFGLVGVNGIDVVLARDDAGRPFPVLVEVNPRYTASMELVEGAQDLSVLALHVEAVRTGVPPGLSLDPYGPQVGFYGKAVVYARSDVVIPETGHWVESGRRDVPYPGERIASGHPICTVFSAEDERSTCWEALLGAASGVRREIGDRMGGKA